MIVDGTEYSTLVAVAVSTPPLSYQLCIIDIALIKYWSSMLSAKDCRHFTRFGEILNRDSLPFEWLIPKICKFGSGICRPAVISNSMRDRGRERAS